jgi:hypothetical protein
MAYASLNIDGGARVFACSQGDNYLTIFMKWEGDDFILHGTFVYDFATIPTSEKLKE